MQIIDNQDSPANYTGNFNFLYLKKEGQNINNQETKI